MINLSSFWQKIRTGNLNIFCSIFKQEGHRPYCFPTCVYYHIIIEVLGYDKKIINWKSFPHIIWQVKFVESNHQLFFILTKPLHIGHWTQPAQNQRFLTDFSIYPQVSTELGLHCYLFKFHRKRNLIRSKLGFMSPPCSYFSHKFKQCSGVTDYFAQVKYYLEKQS